jgi:hypothetical protein
MLDEQKCVVSGFRGIDREMQKILFEVRGVSKYSLTLSSAGDDVVKGVLILCPARTFPTSASVGYCHRCL